MRLSYKYRIYPTRKQTKVLNHTLDSCRWLYNHFLEQRKTAWEKDKTSISMYDQIKQLPGLKKDHEHFNNVYSQVLQKVPERLDLAFKAFFRRVKAGEDPGFPRFKSRFRYDSFTYPQWNGHSAGIKDDKLHLSKIGEIKIKLHRDIQGTPKTCTIKRSSTRKWYATIACDDVPVLDKQPVFDSVGIDVGIESFATLSNGTKIPNPRFFKTEERNLAKVQSKFDKLKKGSDERNRYRKVLSRVHERIANRRHNFIHQESRKIVNQYELICVEDLNINKMLQKGKRIKISKSISDAAWGGFLHALDYKAVEAGSQVVKVNPAYTSQTCHKCGYRASIPLKERVFKCPDCKLELDRDHNAAFNILTLGTQCLASV